MKTILARKYFSLTIATFLFIGLFVSSFNTAFAAGTVTLTKHTDLGFNTSMPVSVDTGVSSPPCLLTLAGICVFHGAVAFNGTLRVSADFGVDIAMTYNPADLNTPGGPMPVSIVYTPTAGGSTVSYSLSGTLTLNFDGCSSCPEHLAVSGTSTPTSFTAPMGSDSPITIPGSGTPLTLYIAGVPIITATIASTLTLAPAPAGLVPGLGGAAAVISTTGAGGAPIIPIEWDSSGSTQSFTLTAPTTPSAVGVTLGPLVHWVNTSGSAQMDLHWTSDFQSAVATLINILGDCILPFCVPLCVAFNCTISDPSPVVFFSGGLGPVYKSAGLDTDIGNAIGGTAGSLVAARVAAGLVPVPLTSPTLANIPPITPGSVTFEIPSTSISGAPTDVLLNGNSVNLTAVPSGGTAPYTYSWDRDGSPFATTQSITDVPDLGNTTYSVTVTDSLGAVSNTASVEVRTYNFSVSGSPTSIMILTTGSNFYGVTEALQAGSYTSDLPTISLSLSGLPAGASPSFSPGSGSANGFNSNLTITTAGAAAGTYTLTLVGNDTRPMIGGTRSSTLTLEVITQQQALQLIINTILGFKSSGVLTNGQANSLITKLNHAITNLNMNQQPQACQQLHSFVNQVLSYVAEGVLTQAQANLLLEGPLGVYAIMASIPC